MTLKDKKKKAAMIAVAYYIQQEAEKANKKGKDRSVWAEMGLEMTMDNRTKVQRRGRFPFGG